MNKRPRCGKRTRLAEQQWGTTFRDSSTEPVLSEVEELGMTTRNLGTNPKGFGVDAQRSPQLRTILPELPDFISSMASLNCA
jgi:hypothetical protein